VIVTFDPPTVSTPVRDAASVFGDAEKKTAPDPVPLAGVTVIQETALEACQAQVEDASTARLPLAPAAASVIAPGDATPGQTAAAWLIEID
jgi:hypothetical protein